MENITPEAHKNLHEVVPAMAPGRGKPGPKPQAVAVKSAAEPSEIVDRKDLNYQWRKGKELVRGRFINDETPGEAKAFAFRKFKQDPIKIYTLKDQGIYEIPLSVAQHLNEDGKLPIYGHSKDEDGMPIEVVTSYKKRYHFESLEFSVLGGEDNYYGKLDKPKLREIAS